MTVVYEIMTNEKTFIVPPICKLVHKVLIQLTPIYELHIASFPFSRGNAHKSATVLLRLQELSSLVEERMKNSSRTEMDDLTNHQYA